MKKPKHKNTSGNYAWELMLPVLLNACVLPLIVRFALYDSGLDKYPWYAGTDGIRTDLFSLHKSRFFVFLVFFMFVILLFRGFLSRNSVSRDPAARMKKMDLFLPLCGYAVMVILSSILSENKTASLYGNLGIFESVFVLLGYPVLAAYVYQTMREEIYYRIFLGGLAGVFCILTLIGMLQIFGIHPLTQTWLQKWIMNPEDFELFGGTLQTVFIGSYVFGTLDNPSHAGIWFSMLFFVWTVLAMTEKKNRLRAFYGTFAVLSLILIWFTKSRTAIVSLAVGLAVLILILRKQYRKHFLTRTLPIAGAFLVLLLIIDGLAGFPFLSRFKETNRREPLTSILTTPEGVSLTYDGVSYVIGRQSDAGEISYEIERQEDTGEIAYEIERQEDTGEIAYEIEQQGDDGEDSYEVEQQTDAGISRALPGEEVSVTADPSKKEFTLHVADLDLDFVKEKLSETDPVEGNWYYKTPWGVLEPMVPIPHVDFHGLEYLGSARLYIWSRALPLLPGRILTGSGPDSFAEVFPQNDYAGKAVYADRTDRVIEKGHNDILTKWIQTGGLSVLFLLLFFSLFLWKGYRSYSGGDFAGRLPESSISVPLSLQARCGLGSYLACIAYLTGMLFQDSSLQETPLFWILVGISLCGIK